MSRHLARHRVIGSAALVTAAGLAALATAGSAYAYFRSAGSGAGSATTGTITLTSTATAGTGLYPGGSVPVPVRVTNTSNVPLTISSITAGTFSVDAQHPGCSTAGVISFNPGDLSGAVGAGASKDLASTVAMSTGSANACQGATFTATLTVTGRAG